ncbi:hypothetical protein [Helicobacter ailurogastricus]|uniref:hypothetical protein n=1 Tax=Helicobacter ailurogastricus TaxID=1578720 RepID=UPI000CF187BD|nr:hypothetical protein [Helicobacter ailurogastricus]
MDHENQPETAGAASAAMTGANGTSGGANEAASTNGGATSGGATSGANEASASAEELELETIKQELAQAEASLETDFAKYAAAHMEAFEQDFWDDREAFVKKILELQNQFLQDKLGGKIQRAKELQTTIAGQQTTKDMQAGQEAFLQKNPEADIEAMGRFYTEDLPPKYRQQLDSLSGEEFWNVLYELYNAYTNGVAQQEEPLPKRVEGNPATASSGGQEMVMNRF